MTSTIPPLLKTLQSTRTRFALVFERLIDRIGNFIFESTDVEPDELLRLSPRRRKRRDRSGTQSSAADAGALPPLSSRRGAEADEMGDDQGDVHDSGE